MQIITEKDLIAKKKPVQVYFDRETLMLVQAKLAGMKPKIGMAEYIRGVIEKDVEESKKKFQPRKWMTLRIDSGGLTSDARELDKIIYGL